MSGSRLLSSLVLSMALIFAVAGCATDTQTESGSLSLELVINGDTEIDEVDWTITQDDEVIKSGTINTSAAGATASVEAYGLEPGGYTIMMEAVSTDGETTCKGKAMFDIEVGEVTEVHVMMNCKPPRRFGAVRVNGTFNICPVLRWADVSPLQTSVGNDIDLFAMATDEEGDPITYMWSSGSGMGIADPMAAATTYTCTAVGGDTITILVTDDGGDYCMDMHTVPVTCVAGDGDPCEGVICEDTGNECTSAACNPGTGECETSNIADGTDCDGGAGMCMAGSCVAKDLCMDVICEDDGNECTAEVCNPGTGECETSNVDDGTACGDGGACMSGSCIEADLCESVVCDDTGNECTTAACNPGTGECETSNVVDGTDCDGGAGMCMAGTCIAKDLCMDVECPDLGECQNNICNPDTGECVASNVDDGTACDNDTGTCQEGECVPSAECAVDGDCPATGNECIDPVCNAGTCETSNNTNACNDNTGTCSAGVCEPNVEALYAQDFEPPMDPSNPSALIDDTAAEVPLGAWLFFGNVFDGTQDPPTFKFPFGPFGAPNATADTNPNDGQTFVSAVVTGEGDTPQGAQQLSVFSDYNCCDPDPLDPGVLRQGHGNGTDLVQINVFQELNPIPNSLIGQTLTFSFDAKRGNIEGVTTALAFITTLDPGAGFAQTNFVPIDLTSIPATWDRYSITLDLTAPLLEGQILQVGFRNTAQNFEGSGIFYDNVLATLTPTAP